MSHDISHLFPTYLGSLARVIPPGASNDDWSPDFAGRDVPWDIRHPTFECRLTLNEAERLLASGGPDIPTFGKQIFVDIGDGEIALPKQGVQPLMQAVAFLSNATPDRILRLWASEGRWKPSDDKEVAVFAFRWFRAFVSYGWAEEADVFYAAFPDGFPIHNGSECSMRCYAEEAVACLRRAVNHGHLSPPRADEWLARMIVHGLPSQMVLGEAFQSRWLRGMRVALSNGASFHERMPVRGWPSDVDSGRIWEVLSYDDLFNLEFLDLLVENGVRFKDLDPRLLDDWLNAMRAHDEAVVETFSRLDLLGVDWTRVPSADVDRALKAVRNGAWNCAACLAARGCPMDGVTDTYHHLGRLIDLGEKAKAERTQRRLTPVAFEPASTAEDDVTLLDAPDGDEEPDLASEEFHEPEFDRPNGGFG